MLGSNLSSLRRAGGPWLAFGGLVLVLGVLHLAVLWRALGREQDAVLREVHAELRESARSVEARLAEDLARAERTLARGADDVPPFAIALRRSDDGQVELAGIQLAVTTMPPACEGLGLELGSTTGAARAALVSRVLAECPLTRGPSGALLVPLLAAHGEVAAPAFSAWQAAHRDPPDATALRRLDAVIAALSQQAAQGGAAPMVRVDLAEGRVRVRREDGAYRGWLVTPASLVKSLHPTSNTGLDLALGQHSTSTLQEPVVAGPFRLVLSVRNEKIVADRSARSRGLVIGLSLASLLLTLGTSFALLRRMSHLRRENELRVDFVAAVSHELRTPLASMQLLTELLRREELPAAERAAALASLDESTTRLAAQTERWLTLARLGRAGLAVHRVDGDLAAAVRTLAARFSQARSVAVEVDGPDALMFAYDPFLLELIVDNVLENACKYAPEGAPYRLRLTADSYVRARGAVLTYLDTGPGFPANAERLLQPFERGDARLHRATEGVGLGLALVAGAARAHGGRVTLDNVPSGGARIVISLEAS